MEMINTAGFSDLSNDELMEIDGGVAPVILGGFFVAGVLWGVWWSCCTH